jgi:hypothetical protein
MRAKPNASAQLQRSRTTKLLPAAHDLKVWNIIEGVQRGATRARHCLRRAPPQSQQNAAFFERMRMPLCAAATTSSNL